MIEPFPIVLVPAEIQGWAERESDRADLAESRVEQERAAKERATARAEVAEARPARAEQRLRDAGVDDGES